MHIIIAGYTGLTGSFALSQLQAHQGVSKIFCIGRRPPGDTTKTEFIPFENVKGETGSPEAHGVICCVGTTMAAAGSKEAFRNVDYELPVRLARWTRQRASKYVLMSSVGASKVSKNFYLRTKADTEEAVRKEFRGPVYILQPSMLRGPRKEKRLGERIGLFGSKLILPFLNGKLAIYKPIQAADVASTMVSLAVHDNVAPSVLTYNDIMRFARA